MVLNLKFKKVFLININTRLICFILEVGCEKWVEGSWTIWTFLHLCLWTDHHLMIFQSSTMTLCTPFVKSSKIWQKMKKSLVTFTFNQFIDNTEGISDTQISGTRSNSDMHIFLKIHFRFLQYYPIFFVKLISFSILILPCLIHHRLIDVHISVWVLQIASYSNILNYYFRFCKNTSIYHS